ncbi:hypothetical protein FGG08_006293 [Glutinoglossum americanum]|uniref:Uncharacterized protein n=1 Tax=Glutinoglossum americanum TaxID=1670608 RepID=A0A9P8I169_9PEZI|nr:hypothetical protein FGG08_006293 [Glutinoglossum americanum]
MTATLIGPLTTIFTPPSACFGLTSISSFRELWLGFDISCGPESSSVTGGFYSPGICPSGFTSACPIGYASLLNGDGGTAPEITLGKGELGHKCCPTGFTCLSSDFVPYICQATFLPPTTVPYWVSGRFASSYVTITAGGYTTAQTRAVCVIWKQEDLSLFPTAVAATLERSEPTPTPTSTVGSSRTDIAISTTSQGSPGGSGGSGGFPRSTAIVIGVLIPVVVLSLLISLFFWFRHQRQTPRQDQQQEDPNPGYQVSSQLDTLASSPLKGQHVQNYGNQLALPILPGGADLSMGRESVWVNPNPDAELPAPEQEQTGGLGYTRKFGWKGY